MSHGAEASRKRSRLRGRRAPRRSRRKQRRWRRRRARLQPVLPAHPAPPLRSMPKAIPPAGARPRRARIRSWAVPGGATTSSLDAPPDVSVVVPCRDGWPDVRRTVASALGQQDVRVEVIVVDDGSTVPLADQLTPVFAGDERLRVLRVDTPQRQAFARNTGIAAARAPWVAFLGPRRPVGAGQAAPPARHCRRDRRRVGVRRGDRGRRAAAPAGAGARARRRADRGPCSGATSSPAAGQA